MIVAFKGSFLRDVSSLRDRQVKNEIRNIIQQVKEAPHVSQIQRLVKLRKYKVHYRIEVEGNYRIGLMIRNNNVWLVRVLHRSKIYNEFP